MNATLQLSTTLSSAFAAFLLHAPLQGHEPFNLESFQVPLREWVEHEPTKFEIKRLFVS